MIKLPKQLRVHIIKTYIELSEVECEIQGHVTNTAEARFESGASWYATHTSLVAKHTELTALLGTQSLQISLVSCIISLLALGVNLWLN